MKVQEIMTSDVMVCAPETNLAAAALLMKNVDAGVLPVVLDGELKGIITDRDIALALADTDKPASTIPVRDAMSRDPVFCKPTDDIHAALRTMRQARIRRLPIIDKEGEIAGILTMNDVVLTAKPEPKPADVSYEDVVATMKAICEHTHAKPAVKTHVKRAGK